MVKPSMEPKQGCSSPGRCDTQVAATRLLTSQDTPKADDNADMCNEAWYWPSYQSCIADKGDIYNNCPFERNLTGFTATLRPRCEQN